MPAFTVSLFLTITNSFKIFDVNFSLTGGGPSLLWHDKAIQSTEFITMNIYNTASGDNLMAQGQARAVILFFILVVISVVQTTITKRKEIDLYEKTKTRLITFRNFWSCFYSYYS